VVKSQIGNLTSGLSFNHNLCFKYSNGMCEPIWVIYVSRAFQKYKKIFNPMNFDLYDCSLKIRESIGTPIFKVGAHLGVCGFILSRPLTFLRAWNVTPKLHSWLAPLQAFALVASLRLGSQQVEPRKGHTSSNGKNKVCPWFLAFM
jgi:hypothetical protein